MVEHVRTAVENPHWHIVEARKHYYVIGLRKLCDTALRETDVNTGMWILQQP